MSDINSAFFQLKPTLKPECPGSPEFFGKTISAWDSNPRLVSLAVPINQLDEPALTNWLVWAAIKVSREFESQAERFFRKTSKTLDILALV